MKAISLWQPWASLWCATAKIHETRHWQLRHRGWLAVHAAKRIEFDHSERLNDILDSEFGNHWGQDLPRGAFVGLVNIVDCLPTDVMFTLGIPESARDDYECGNFTRGRFAWRRSEFRALKVPIPWKGQQGLFTVPDDLLTDLGRSILHQEGGG